MSWTRQLATTLLRHPFSPSSSSRTPLGYTVLSSPALQQSSRLAHAAVKKHDWTVKEMLGKTMDSVGPADTRSPARIWAEKSDNLNLPPPLDTWTGRRFQVRNGELHSAFQLLNTRLRSNNVPRELSLVARHEKKGDKRARLRSDRWRRRFANAVRMKVQLVDTIRRRGG